MKNAIIDIIDDFRNVELTDKAKSILWTIALVVAGIYWLGLSDYGAFFQLTGFAAFVYCTANCVSKTFWGQRFIESLKGDDEE
jgi:hypothetical protein